jgi:hypothetical protein
MKQPIDPAVSGMISEIERMLRKLKERLKDEAQKSAAGQAGPGDPLPPPSAFGRFACANMSLRPSQKPAAPVVHPTLGTL